MPSASGGIEEVVRAVIESADQGGCVAVLDADRNGPGVVAWSDVEDAVVEVLEHPTADVLGIYAEVCVAISGRVVEAFVEHARYAGNEGLVLVFHAIKQTGRFLLERLVVGGALAVFHGLSVKVCRRRLEIRFMQCVSNEHPCAAASATRMTIRTASTFPQPNEVEELCALSKSVGSSGVGRSSGFSFFPEEGASELSANLLSDGGFAGEAESSCVALLPSSFAGVLT